MTTEELLAGCRSHRRDAQKALYERYKDTLFTSCLKYTGSYEDAQDVLQESFIMAFAKVEQYKGQGNLEGWLRRICINNALATHRKTKEYTLEREEELEQEENTNESQIPLKVLLAMVRKLTDRYRMVFTLYVLEGHSHAEISDLLDISVGTSKSNLSRARAVLADEVREYKKQA